MAKLVFRRERVTGRVHRSSGVCARSGALPSLHRKRAGAAAIVYGRRMYEIMRYWDEEHPEWDAAAREFAAAWRGRQKWVVSRSLKSVGPNATLVGEGLETVIGGLKDRLAGEIGIGGSELARSLTDLGLIDEYQLYFHPVVLGHGTPFFAAPRPRLHLVASDRMDEDVIRLTYVPA